MSDSQEQAISNPSMSSAGAFHALTCPQRVAERVLTAIRVARFGQSSAESSKNRDQHSQSSRTRLGSQIADWRRWFETFPQSGMTRNGSLCELASLALRMNAHAHGLWPTPTRSDASLSRRHGYMLTGHIGTTLTDAVNSHHGGTTREPGQTHEAQWCPNPEFVEALMGLSPGWTCVDSQPSATPSSRKSRKSSVGSCGG